MMSASSAPIPALMKMAVPPLDPFSSLFSSAAPQKDVSQRPGSCAAHLSPGKVMLLCHDDVVGAAFDKLLEGTPSSSISSRDSETVRRLIGDVAIPSSVYILPREVVYPGGSIDLATLLGSQRRTRVLGFANAAGMKMCWRMSIVCTSLPFGNVPKIIEVFKVFPAWRSPDLHFMEMQQTFRMTGSITRFPGPVTH